MKLQFLGHGLTDENDFTVGNYLRNSFKDPNYTSFECFVAYTTLSGLSIFIDELEEAKSRFSKIELYLGVDDKGTSKEALQELLKRKIDTYIYHNPTKRSRKIYHPKLYLFKGELTNRFLLGSSNLTRPGLFQNVEASLSIDFTNGDLQGMKLSKQIEDYFSSFFEKTHINLKKLDEELLSDLIRNNVVAGEKEIFSKEEYEEKGIVTNEEGDAIFTPEEANGFDIDELDTVESDIDKKNISKSKSNVALTEYYYTTWTPLFEKYKKFVENSNPKTIVVPDDYANPSLYNWYKNQKILYNEERIPEEHLDKLIAVNFPFGEDGAFFRWNRVWEERYSELKSFYEQYGHSSVAMSVNNTPELDSLASWVTMQCYFKKHNDKRMTKYRIKKLEELNFIWERGYGRGFKKDDNWLELLEKYSEFKKINKREPQQVLNPEEYSIARWRGDQVTARNRGKLSKERVELLESEGIIWDLDLEKFNLKLKSLLKYFDEFKNFEVPFNYPPDKSLGTFVNSLRRRGTTSEFKKILEKYGMTGVILRSEAVKSDKKSHITTEWSQNFKILQSLENKGVDLNKITKDYPDNPKLGYWLYNQKNRYRTNSLNDEQENLFLKTTLNLSKENPWEARWNTFYELLTEYFLEKGNCQVPPSYDEELSRWCGIQRRANRQNELSKERITKLNAINFEWIAQIGKR
jgi:HKD family nuclease